ncbi:prolyl 4-hydroxylase subunit alpha-1 [Sardina pilchardus]|uniref:prolyl 4-hydroxylase subunit alpha-1 n=1 Tax=Sardina pilchardus TaxID=27697 RepID=UPI002E0EDAC2
MVLRQLMLFLLLGKISTGHEYYSSTEEMEDLMIVDQTLMLNLAKYIKEETTHIQELNRVLRDLRGLSVTQPDLSDPITAYQLVNRIKWKFDTMVEYIKKRPSEDFLQYLSSTLEALPEQDEVDGVALGLIRLQEIYGLEPQSIMGHGLPGTEQASRLDPDECFHVAKVAYKNEKFELACLWLQEAYQLMQQGEAAWISTWDAKLLFASSAFSLGDVHTAIDITEEVVDADPANEEAKLQLLKYRLHRVTKPVFFGTIDLFTIPEPSNTSHEALCRSQRSRMTPHRQRALFCRYSTAGGNPRLMYAPVKEEDEWDHPRIVRYHNVLSEQEMDMIKTMATPELSRSRVVTGYGETGHVTENRVSKSMWFNDSNPSVSHIIQRIADITSLDMETAESLQVLNYGVGGHFGPHYDAGEEIRDEDGDRIATVLIYLSDVEMGGATVFPLVGAALRPIKGSAVMWFNLLQNGEVDKLSRHSGCPVFKGNKWVANKWIRERGQEFRRRCSLNYWE